MISGMTCSACSNMIESVVKDVKGVEEINVNLLMETAKIVYRPGEIGIRTLIREINDLGFTATLPEKETVGSDTGHSDELMEALQLSFLFTIPTVLFLFLNRVEPTSEYLSHDIVPNLNLLDVLLLILATPMQFVVGMRFYQGAYKALRRR